MGLQSNMGPTRTHLVIRPELEVQPPLTRTRLSERPVEGPSDLPARLAALEARVTALETTRLSARLSRLWAWVVAQYRYAASFWSTRP